MHKINVHHKVIRCDIKPLQEIMETYNILDTTNGNTISTPCGSMIVVKHRNYDGLLLGKYQRTIYIVSPSSFVPTTNDSTYIGYYTRYDPVSRRWYKTQVLRDSTEKDDWIIENDLKKRDQWPFD